MSSAIIGPHQAIPVADERERFLVELFDQLWDRYRQRVTYVRQYEQVVRSHGATFVNDHIAFRTFASQQPLAGIATLSRIFEALGYRAAGVYNFQDKYLSAVHFQHANRQFPKLFVSELRTWELEDAAQIVNRYTSRHRPAIDLQSLADLHRCQSVSAARSRELLGKVLAEFLELPWPLPEKEDVVALNRVSQYAAWVLVHGYNVNHFTSLVNSHGVDSLGDLEKTMRALRDANIPMKAEIEGERGSKLRQSSTEAVMIDVDVMERGRPSKFPWTYAYFELAERNEIVDPATGQKVRFEGFLGPQATNLFEMTRVR
jgi:hypothetical protein